jgi:hypothetical protein
MKMRRFIQFVVFPVLVLGLVACQPPVKPKYDQISFTHLPPIELNVAEIIINTPYQEPLEPPHVGEQFPVSPSRAARNWAEDRLRAVGSSGTATVTIVESGAVETELARTTGVTGLLTKDQAQSYEVAIAMTVEAVQTDGTRGLAEARVTKKNSVVEDANVNERETVWHKLTQDTMNSFNESMERQIGSYLAKFLK